MWCDSGLHLLSSALDHVRGDFCVRLILSTSHLLVVYHASCMRLLSRACRSFHEGLNNIIKRSYDLLDFCLCTQNSGSAASEFVDVKHKQLCVSGVSDVCLCLNR